ncbi:iron-containing alcohol dehydrogenase family protein [Halanaerobium saccharolyticum]|nr:iron-containing alcohol dehydrogenase family protein [Halanaerobium saccharolyticum]
MHLVMGSPNRYMQEKNILAEAGQHIAPLGKKALLVGDETTLEVVREKMNKSLKESEIEFREEIFGGEVTKKEAHRIAALLEKDNFDLIIGIGGGKAIDTAKAAAAYSDRKLITIPTIASNCAAWTPLSVFYDQQGTFEEYIIFQYSPVLVLVDTEIIADSPLNYFKAGIADTVVKFYEARASAANKEKNAPTRAALKVAEECKDVLFEFGVQAAADLENKKATKAVEKTVDSIIALGGMVGGIGGDNCRIAGAHAVHNGLTVLPETHDLLHGEKVAFGNLVQLELEKNEAEFDELLSLLNKLDQPVTLAQLGLDRVTDSDLARVAAKSCSSEESIHNLPFKITEAAVLEAIKNVDSKAKEYLSQLG